MSYDFARFRLVVRRFQMKRRVFCTVLALLLAIAASVLSMPSSFAARTAGTYILPLFETSDTHGYLAETSGSSCQYRLAYISDKVKDVRGHGDAYRSDLALLLDGGDIYQGYALSNLLDGQSLAAAYELMDYDAVTIGNHEFDWGIENTVQSDRTMIDSSLEGASIVNDTPVVISNLYLNGDKVTFAQDYVIVEKTATDGAGSELPVRIGVIGFAEDYSSSIMYKKFTGAGYSIVPDISIVESIAHKLEASGACDATVLLCHAPAQEVALGLSDDTDIDLVLGGHTHVNDCGRTDSGIPYIQPANNGQAYCYAEMTFSLTEDGVVFGGVQNAGCQSTVVDIERLYDLPDNVEELDSAVIALSNVAAAMIYDILNTEVGYITVPVLRNTYIPGSGDRSCTAGNWMASIIRRGVGADVGFVNAGGIRMDITLLEGQEKRGITRSDIYAMFPFENALYCYELTYEDLLTLLQYSLTDNGRRVFSRIDGIDCYFSEEKVNAIVTADGETVYANGEWKDDWRERTLLVCVSEYLATTDRPSGDVHNPLLEWNETERLLSSDTIDIEAALALLSDEAANNGGHLFIDERPHYISGVYEAPEESPNTGDDSNVVLWTGIMVLALAGIVTINATCRKRGHKTY